MPSATPGEHSTRCSLPEGRSRTGSDRPRPRVDDPMAGSSNDKNPYPWPSAPSHRTTVVAADSRPEWPALALQITTHRGLLADPGLIVMWPVAGGSSSLSRASTVIGHITRPGTEAGQPAVGSDQGLLLRPRDQPHLRRSGHPLRHGRPADEDPPAPGRGSRRGRGLDRRALGLGPAAQPAFFSLAELNAAIAVEVAKVNARPFRGEATSRKDLFDELERPALRPLPASRYELAEWKKGNTRPPVKYHR